MKNPVKNIVLIVSIFAFALILSGCIMASPIENMYALPQLPPENVNLQTIIDGFLETGAEYSAPASGSNRSAIQAVDLDGDGSNEIVGYFRRPGEDKPLKINIYDIHEDGTCTQRAVIEGEGTSIESVSYTDLDGDGVSEVIVGWQISADLKIMYIYSIKETQIQSLASTEYSAFTIHTLRKKAGSDVVVIKLSTTADTAGEVTEYSLMEDGELESSTAYLSKGIISLSRIRTSYLNDGASAVYIEGTTGSNILTDIFVYKNRHLENIMLDAEKGVSLNTSRTYGVYSMDINNDGILEIPAAESLIPQKGSSTAYYILKWYTYNSRGVRKLTMTTFHDYSDGWYLQLPDDWIGNISIRRDESSSGERVVVFSLVKGEGEFEDFLKIYTLTGENRFERANQKGRFIISNNDAQNGTIYVGQFLVDDIYDYEIESRMETIQKQFSLIYTEWVTGAI